MHIVPPVVLLVGIVGLIVVLEAVDPTIVVHVHAEQELGSVRVVSQEGLFIVGEEVLLIAAAVLVEI